MLKSVLLPDLALFGGVHLDLVLMRKKRIQYRFCRIQALRAFLGDGVRGPRRLGPAVDHAVTDERDHAAAFPWHPGACETCGESESFRRIWKSEVMTFQRVVKSE